MLCGGGDCRNGGGNASDPAVPERGGIFCAGAGRSWECNGFFLSVDSGRSISDRACRLCDFP